MRRKVFTTMLFLVIGVMIAYYVLKFFFPEKFLLIITDPDVLRFGEFLENHKIFDTIFSILMSFVTLYLFSCSSASKTHLNWWKTLIVVSIAIFNVLTSPYWGDLYLHTSIITMFLCACLENCKLRQSVLIFGVHGYLQLCLLNIRGFETILPIMNKATMYTLGFENLVWLVLFYIIFNFKKEKKYEY